MAEQPKKYGAWMCKPSVALPEFRLAREEMFEILAEHYADVDTPKVRQILVNTRIERRALSAPFKELWNNQDPTWRHEVYMRTARAIGKQACLDQLKVAGIKKEELGCIIVTSCTGFAFPSLCAHMINDLDLVPTIKQLPIAQLGCAAATVAIQQAQDYLKAYPGSNVLILNVELCSMLYQKEECDLGTLICNGIFGDSATATVMRGTPTDEGKTLALKLDDVQFHYVLQNSIELLYYDVSKTGWTFRLSRELAGAIVKSGEPMRKFGEENKIDFKNFQSYILHTGGPKVLTEVVEALDLPEVDERGSSCLESLRDTGNTASCMVMDIMSREFVKRKVGDRALIGSFGPGFTVALSFGTYETI